MGSGAQASGSEGGFRGSDPPSLSGDLCFCGDLHSHELAIAQMAAASVAAERLDAAYARLEQRIDRIAVSMAAIDTEAVQVSPGQLRLVG